MIARVILLALSLVNGQDVSLYIENLGPSELGVFFGGDMFIDRDLTVRDYFYEKFVDKVPPATYVQHDTFNGHSFVVRTADFQTRIRVNIEQGPSREHPYKITFINLSADNDLPQVELRHSTSGFVWIEGTEHVVHNTALHHPFDIRNSKREPVMRFILRPPSKGEL